MLLHCVIYIVNDMPIQQHVVMTMYPNCARAKVHLLTGSHAETPSRAAHSSKYENLGRSFT
jgi:hypothetical protein